MDYKVPQEDSGGLTEPLQNREPSVVVGAEYCPQKAEQFTLDNAIFTKSWSITNANGQEVFLVRGKTIELFKTTRELVDMDGNAIVLMKRFKPWSWIGVWKAFAPGNEEEPLWTMRKSSFCSFGPQLQIFLPSNTEREIADYTIKGQWLCKKCTIFFGQQKVAEVVRNASFQNILTAKSIFHVLVQPGVDTAFIFSLIVIMDLIYIHGCKSNPGGGL